MCFAKSPIFDLRPVAHVWVSLGSSDGQHVCISVEARGVKERPYVPLRSLVRQFQLIYVVGDGRDVVGLRGAAWQSEARFSPASTAGGRKRAIFAGMLKRADSLGRRPEFYHLIASNCMDNITDHICRLGGRPLPGGLALLLTGFSDRAAHDYGFLDTRGPTFAQARRACRIDRWVRSTPLDDSFSRRLREQLARQVADMAAGKTPAE
jgi:hypothetical protein